MDKWVALNDKSAGKDKIARFLQYLSRAIWDSLDQNERSPALVSQLKTLEYILSSFRKLLRFGKCFEVFYSSLKSIHYPDLTIRVSLTLSKLSLSLFLFSDHMLWLSRTGLFRSIDTKKWGQIANKYWLLAIVMNLVRDMYEIFRLINLRKAAQSSGIITRQSASVSIRSFQDLSKLVLVSYSHLHLHKDVVVDTIKNLCDVFIPLTALGYTKLNPYTIGVLGTVSSLAGLLSLIQPDAKLTPM